MNNPNSRCNNPKLCWKNNQKKKLGLFEQKLGLLEQDLGLFKHDTSWDHSNSFTKKRLNNKKASVNAYKKSRQQPISCPKPVSETPLGCFAVRDLVCLVSCVMGHGSGVFHLCLVSGVLSDGSCVLCLVCWVLCALCLVSCVLMSGVLCLDALCVVCCVLCVVCCVLCVMSCVLCVVSFVLCLVSCGLCLVSCVPQFGMFRSSEDKTK